MTASFPSESNAPPYRRQAATSVPRGLAGAPFAAAHPASRSASAFGLFPILFSPGSVFTRTALPFIASRGHPHELRNPRPRRPRTPTSSVSLQTEGLGGNGSAGLQGWDCANLHVARPNLREFRAFARAIPDHRLSGNAGCVLNGYERNWLAIPSHCGERGIRLRLPRECRSTRKKPDRSPCCELPPMALAESELLLGDSITHPVAGVVHWLRGSGCRLCAHHRAWAEADGTAHAHRLHGLPRCDEWPSGMANAFVSADPAARVLMLPWSCAASTTTMATPRTSWWRMRSSRMEPRLWWCRASTPKRGPLPQPPSPTREGGYRSPSPLGEGSGWSSLASGFLPHSRFRGRDMNRSVGNHGLRDVAVSPRAGSHCETPARRGSNSLAQ